MTEQEKSAIMARMGKVGDSELGGGNFGLELRARWLATAPESCIDESQRRRTRESIKRIVIFFSMCYKHWLYY